MTHSLLDGLLDIFVFVLSTSIVAGRYRRGVVRIVPGDMVLWTFTLFFIAPLPLDAIGYVESYRIYPGLNSVFGNSLVRVVTDFTIVLCALLLSRAVRRSSEFATSDADFPAVRRWVWAILAFAPLAVIVGAPDPLVYEHFAAAISQRDVGQAFNYSGGTFSASARYHVYVTWSTYLSAISLCAWLIARKTPRAFLLVAPVAAMDFWIGGKRNVIAVLAILVVYAIARNQTLTRKELRRIGFASVVALLLALGISQQYQDQYRDYAVHNDSHEVFKVDFGRTDVLRLSIAGQLGVAPRALEFPGQGALLYADAIVGRLNDEKKDVSYQDRVTSIAMGQPLQETPGAITTSIISESIDNFGWLGILIGPAILSFLIYRSSRTRDPVIGLLLALTAAMLLVTELLVVLPLLALVGARMIRLRHSAGKRSHNYEDRKSVGMGGLTD